MNSYDVRFVHRFLVAAVTVTARLTQPDWSTPGCVAEALALDLVLDAAHSLLARHDLVDDDVPVDLQHGLDDTPYDDLDHEWLYSPALDGFENDPEFQTRLGVANMYIDQPDDARDEPSRESGTGSRLHDHPDRPACGRAFRPDLTAITARENALLETGWAASRILVNKCRVGMHCDGTPR